VTLFSLSLFIFFLNLTVFFLILFIFFLNLIHLSHFLHTVSASYHDFRQSVRHLHPHCLHFCSHRGPSLFTGMQPVLFDVNVEVWVDGGVLVLA
jgi:CHASE3 domain sensor protein